MSADRAPIRVLHVDDDPDLRALAAEMLALESGRVETVGATDAAEALAALDPGTVDCVVSDYELVDTDGVELLRRVRERDASLPFVLFTGKGSEEVASEAISAGVTDYLQKGGGRETYAILANRIENAVEAHRASTRAEDRQRRLEQVVETVPGCVVQLDREGRFVLANDRAEEVLGLTESALSTRTYDDPEWRIRDLDGDPIPDEELPFRRVLDTGEPVEGVRHAIDWPDGTRKVLRVNGAPLFDGAGEVASVVFSLTDVTERLRDRRELEAMHDRLETLVSNLPVVLFGIDDSGTFTLSEGKGLAALGFDPGEVVGREVDEVYADVPAIREDVARALDGEPARGRYDLEGSVFDVVYEPVGSSRAETAVVGVGYDVTERTRRETQLQRSREQHRTLVENFPNGGVFMFDSDLRYTLAGRGTGVRRSHVRRLRGEAALGPVPAGDRDGVGGRLPRRARRRAARVRAVVRRAPLPGARRPGRRRRDADGDGSRRLPERHGTAEPATGTPAPERTARGVRRRPLPRPPQPAERRDRPARTRERGVRQRTPRRRRGRAGPLSGADLRPPRVRPRGDGDGRADTGVARRRRPRLLAHRRDGRGDAVGRDRRADPRRRGGSQTAVREPVPQRDRPRAGRRLRGRRRLSGGVLRRRRRSRDRGRPARDGVRRRRLDRQRRDGVRPLHRETDRRQPRLGRDPHGGDRGGTRVEFAGVETA